MPKKMVYPILLFVCMILFIGMKWTDDQPTEETEKKLFEGYTIPIIFDGKLFQTEAKMEDGLVFLPEDVIKEVMDADIHMEEKTNTYTITTENRVLLFDNKQMETFMNGESFEVSIQSTKEDGTYYIPASVLETLYPFDVQYNEKQKNVVLIEKNKPYQKGIVLSFEETSEKAQKKQHIVVKERAESESATVARIQEDEKVMILHEKNGYYLIQQETGTFGYVEKKDIALTEIEMITKELNKKTRWKPVGEKINLTWEAVYGENPDIETLPKLNGVNVVSPTWFALSGTEGMVTNTADVRYVNWAHQRGYQVWALFANDFQKPDNTHAVLSDAHKRAEVVRQLVAYSKMYDLDGINIDFENIHSKDKPYVLQFVKELTPYLHEEGMVVSMDITFISNSDIWSNFLDRKALVEVVDYLIVMAYDEHWQASPTAGSVASLPWVEKNLKTLLKQVPNEKLILGMPFYMRVWEEKGEKVSSETLTIKYLEDYLKDKQLTPKFDPKTKQNYIEFKKDRSIYKIWVEDETSIKERISLVKQYELAGIASWNRGFSDTGIWDVIDKELKK